MSMRPITLHHQCVTLIRYLMGHQCPRDIISTGPVMVALMLREQTVNRNDLLIISSL